MTLMFTIQFNDHGKVINKSSSTVFFVFLLLYIISGIMFCFFMSVFFSKASTAAAGGGIIWYVTFIPFFFIAQSYDEMSLSLKTAACLIPNLAMSLGSIVIGKFEGILIMTNKTLDCYMCSSCVFDMTACRLNH